MRRVRVAVISEHDQVWSLPAWERAVDLLIEDGHNIVGIWSCPKALSTHRGSDVTRWYMTAFGIVDFCKLAAFAVVAHLSRLAGALFKTRAASFQKLAARTGANYGQCKSPNDRVFVSWLRENNIDVLLITVGFILGEDVLSVPTLGTVNKHASLLPANRGLFPYFWATLHGTRQGVSYHLVTPGIDEGPLLVQDKIIPEKYLSTMIRFYLYVFGTFSQRIRACVRILADSEVRTDFPAVQKSYYGLPTRKDVRDFRRRGGRIIALTDILMATQIGRFHAQPDIY